MHCGCLGVRFWDLLMLQEAVETSLEGAEAAGPMFTGPSSLLWIVVCACLFVFALFIILIIRGQAARAAKRMDAQGETFFKPAGDQADLSFGDEPQAVDQHPPESAQHSETIVTVEVEEPAREQEEDLQPEDDVNEQKSARAPSKNPFAGLFSKKNQEDDKKTGDEPVEEQTLDPVSEPTSQDEQPLTAFFERKAEAIEAEVIIEPAPASDESFSDAKEDTPSKNISDDALAAATAAFATQDKKNEPLEPKLADQNEINETAILAAKAENDALLQQLSAEKEQLETEKAKVQADREAEFERRKQDAAIAQRLRNIEVADMERTLSQHLTKAIDARFSILAERIEGKIASLRTNDESAVAAATSAFSNETKQLAARFDEHRSTVSAALIALTDRIAQSASDNTQEAQDLSGLYDEIASLRTAMRDALAERPVSTAPPAAARPATVAAPAAQLSDILLNALPPDQYQLSAPLRTSTGAAATADALIKLPALSAPIAVDARFPMDAFYAYEEAVASGTDIDKAQKTFRRAALRHVVTVAENLVVHDETAPSAFMFAPSEALFTALHQHFSDVVHDAYRARVWITSPTSLMASLHTMSAALRDASAQSQSSIQPQKIEPPLKEEKETEFLFSDDQIERMTPFLEETQDALDEAQKPQETDTQKEGNDPFPLR